MSVGNTRQNCLKVVINAVNVLHFPGISFNPHRCCPVALYAIWSVSQPGTLRMNLPVSDAPAWITVNGDGRQVAGPYVLRFLAELKAHALGPDYSITPVLNVGKGGSTASWWPI
jgi:hypothetical protein